MRTRLGHYSRRLPTRLVLSFTLVVALSALLVGIPALFLIEAQLVGQAEARLAQGANATRALHDARRRELLSLTTLTAQRPTLHQLLQEEAGAALPPYLDTIRQATQVDLLVVTDVRGEFVVYSPTDLAPAFAEALLDARRPSPAVSLEVLGQPPDEVAVLVGRVPIQADGGDAIGMVIEGVYLDGTFLNELGAETSLVHTLLVDGQPIVSALTTPFQIMDIRPSDPVWIGDEPFYLRPLPLESQSAEVVDLVALPAGELIATRTRVVQILVVSTLLVTALAALLAHLLARHVTAPLQRLVGASDAVGRGDLATPMPTDHGLVEVALLAHTLEEMRQRLQAAYGELQRAKQWYEDLIASLAEGVATIDEGGRITSFSPGAERILGWKASEVIGHPYELVLRGPAGEEDDPEAPFPRRQVVRTRQGDAVTLRITRGARTLHAQDGWEQAYVFRDVTEQERALQLREFLLANVSHEFKTPLAALRAAVELLVSDLPTFSQSELKALADAIWQGTLRLEELVDNLLGSASLQAGHFAVHPRATDLEVVIEEALLASRPLLTLRGQHLRVEAPSPLAPVQADPRRLHQVLINLISNASKYGPAGGAILLQVEPRATEVRVLLTDQGPGLAREVQGQLFQPFARPREAQQGGIGLGLSIVRAIVERHGGRVGVESRPGEGATFWFTLPYATTTPEHGVGAR